MGQGLGVYEADLTSRRPSWFTWVDEILKRKGKIIVGSNNELRAEILELFLGSTVRGQSELTVRLQRGALILYWKNLKKYLREYIGIRNLPKEQIWSLDIPQFNACLPSSANIVFWIFPLVSPGLPKSQGK